MPGNGSRELAALAARLKATGNKGLRTQLLRGLKTGAAPLIVAVKDSAREKLPKGGGLNEQVAGQRVRVSVRTGARTAGVRLLTTAPDTAQTNSGFVRHPVFNRRNAEGKRIFVRQELPNATGWWTDPLTAGAPLVTPELTAVMVRVAREIQGRV
jgi:hypothetical protein